MVAREIIKSLFGSIWNLFTGVPIPGLGVSCATMLLAVLIIRISITIFHAAFGGGTGYRSGQSRNPKISDERKGDEL